jgi:hypothetical protein
LTKISPDGKEYPVVIKKKDPANTTRPKTNNMLPSFYHSILEKYLTPAQLLTLQMKGVVVTVSERG